MKLLFFGLGSIGARHARLLKENFNHELYAFRSNPHSEKNALGIEEISDLNEVASIKPDVAFITNPTYKHVDYAIFCAKNRINLFIEKPLSHSKEGLEKLTEYIRENNVKMYIAYCLRFHPVIKWLKEHLKENVPLHATAATSSFLPNWRKGINHLEHYSSFKSKGGGVILDLSHEIDYIYYLLGDVKSIKANAKKLGNVTVDSEDFADILVEFTSGTLCNLHLNFSSRMEKRELVLDFQSHTIVADLLSSKITILKDEDKEVIELDSEKDSMYLSQLKYFFSNLDKREMMNGIDEALKVFDIIMNVKKEAK